MTANPAQNKRNATLRLILRLMVLVVVAFGIPDGHAATPDPVAEAITHQSSGRQRRAAFTVTAKTLPRRRQGREEADMLRRLHARHAAGGASRSPSFQWRLARSAYLHLGRWDRGHDLWPDGRTVAARHTADNPDSWLDQRPAPVDPVGTGC
jgi:hypothetical protein